MLNREEPRGCKICEAPLEANRLEERACLHCQDRLDQGDVNQQVSRILERYPVYRVLRTLTRWMEQDLRKGKESLEEYGTEARLIMDLQKMSEDAEALVSPLRALDGSAVVSPSKGDDDGNA